MSNIGSNNITGQSFKPVITNATFDELNNLQINNVQVAANNAIIFSIPQNTDGTDKPGEGSIWISDNDGYLYCMTKPINKS